MEKIKQMLFKDKKTSNLVLILFLLVIVLIVINYIFNSDNKEMETIQTLSTNVKEETSLEKKLSDIISQIDGVDSAYVVISYLTSDKKIPVYDIKENVDKTTEENKTSTKTVVEKNVAFEGNTALIESTETATPNGAIIVVNGNINESTKLEIKNAVSYTTSVPLYKIQIFVN